MSIRSISRAGVLLITLLLAIGCGGKGNSEETSQTASEPATAAAGQSFDQVKAAYISTVRDALEDWAQKIATLEEKRSALPDAAQTAVEEPMQELRDMRDVLVAKVNALEHTTQANYEAGQAAVDEELGAMNKAYDKISAMMK